MHAIQPFASFQQSKQCYRTYHCYFVVFQKIQILQFFFQNF